MGAILNTQFPARSAYVRPSTIAAWRPDDVRRWLDMAVSFGIGALVTKLPNITDELAAQCADVGLEVIGSFTCFSDHDSSPGDPRGIRPIDELGRAFDPMEWYTGLVPGDPELEDHRARRLDELVRRGLVASVVFDFVRWPGHWELESRGGRMPRRSSFDPVTLERFRDFAERRGDDIAGIDPEDAVASAAAIDARLGASWTAFRADTVTSFVRRLSDIAHAAGIEVGVFLVPVPHAERVAHYGQDAVAMAGVVDVFVPMTYHAIAARPPAWIHDLTNETAAITRTPVVAMLQTTASPEYSAGADWGAHISGPELESVTRSLEQAVTDGDLAGVCLFPGEAPPPGALAPTRAHHGPIPEGHR